ncbi:hypothetical protein C8J57DRAFT_1643200 [Mycena rebaudengoi]|nr:hypothetical protein C8J57DRAFT_1643200 [Mycena rebaudengoi]
MSSRYVLRGGGFEVLPPCSSGVRGSGTALPPLPIRATLATVLALVFFSLKSRARSRERGWRVHVVLSLVRTGLAFSLRAGRTVVASRMPPLSLRADIVALLSFLSTDSGATRGLELGWRVASRSHCRCAQVSLLCPFFRPSRLLVLSPALAAHGVIGALRLYNSVASTNPSLLLPFCLFFGGATFRFRPNPVQHAPRAKPRQRAPARPAAAAAAGEPRRLTRVREPVDARRELHPRPPGSARYAGSNTSAPITAGKAITVTGQGVRTRCLRTRRSRRRAKEHSLLPASPTVLCPSCLLLGVVLPLVCTSLSFVFLPSSVRVFLAPPTFSSSLFLFLASLPLVSSPPSLPPPLPILHRFPFRTLLPLVLPPLAVIPVFPLPFIIPRILPFAPSASPFVPHPFTPPPWRRFPPAVPLTFSSLLRLPSSFSPPTPY